MSDFNLAHGMMRNQPRPVGKTQDWCSPPALVQRLGKFDTDPCASRTSIHRFATRNITEDEDGLNRDWSDYGRVWLNPPYHRHQIEQWMLKMKHHGNGMALTFARTETEWFRHVWYGAVGIAFFHQRINFYTPQGQRSSFNSGAPSVLIGYSEYDFHELKNLERDPGDWACKVVRLVP